MFFCWVCGVVSGAERQCHSDSSQINQAKAECGRQSLVELLIRPVQRLPSVALLLNGDTHTATAATTALPPSSLFFLRLLPFMSDLIFMSVLPNSPDIKKHTADDNPDKITLEKAIESLKEVMT